MKYESTCNQFIQKATLMAIWEDIKSFLFLHIQFFYTCDNEQLIMGVDKMNLDGASCQVHRVIKQDHK